MTSRFKLPAEWELFDIQTLSLHSYEKHQAMQQYAADIFNSLKNWLHHKGQITTVFLNERQLNAYAYSVKNNHAIGIPIATPCLIRFYFNRYAELERRFSKKPSKSARQYTFKKFPMLIGADIPMDKAVEYIPGLTRPIEATKEGVASFLAEIANFFILAHEIGHIIAGHTSYFNHTFKENYFSEFSTNTNKSFEEQSIKQVAEYEADIFAIGITTKFYFDNLKVITPILEKNFANAKKAPAIEYELFGIILNSIFGLFLLLGQDRLRNLQSNKYAHPHPVVRANYVNKAMAGVLNRDYAMNMELLSVVSQSSLEDVCEIWEEIGYSFHSSFSANNFWNTQVDNCIHKLSSLYTASTELFKPYRWMDNLKWHVFKK
jgi:hypothetical protein